MPTRDVRTMLAEAGQGTNGRVIALQETYITSPSGSPAT
jgi:hypothetical protein